MRRSLPVWAALFWITTGAADAVAQQSWVDTVLPERAFDAGTVARGSKVHHSFALVNRLNQTVRIATWRTKCGCTEVKVGAREIPPGTQTTIEAVIDTTRFLGHKPSGLTLVLDQPGYVEVDLNFSCFIRGDLTLNPGQADFGIITRAPGVRPSLTMNLSYAGGQPNWGVTRMQTRSASVSAKIEELGRSADGQVQYQLTATLDPSQITGYFKDEITLHTNDPASPTVPVSVTAHVQAAVTVSPAPLILGPLKPGQVVRKTLLVRAAQPFKLTAVTPGKDDFTTTAVDPAEAAKAVHTVTLTFTAPAQPGPYNAAVEIATDIKDEPPARVTAFATVVP